MKNLIPFVCGLFLSGTLIGQTLLKEQDFSDFYQPYRNQFVSHLQPADVNSLNKHLMKEYIHNNTSKFRDSVYQLLELGLIQTNQLQAIFDTKIQSYTSSPNFYAGFSQFKNHYNEHNHGGNRAGVADCANSGMDLNDFSHWFTSVGDECTAYVGCYTGEVVGLFTDPLIENANHFITPGGYVNDPKLLANGAVLPTLCPFPGFGPHSFKLGDDITADHDASRAYYEFVVEPDKPIYSYAFAVVLEDPMGGHNPQGKPYFAIEFTDEDGDPIPNGCADYYVEAGANPGFINVGVGGLQYKDWTRLDVDLNAYIGQTIRVEFRVSDCNLGGHRGYAYIDAICELPEITKAPDCNGIKLSAPEGYFGYSWSTGDVTREIVVPGPGLYSVDLISENGCFITIDTLINDIYVKLQQDAQIVDVSCNGYADGSITINTFGGNPLYQYSIDNGVTFQPLNVFAGLPAGNYTVIIVDDLGCESRKNYTINEPPAMVANIVSEDACFNVCDGEMIINVAGGNSPSGIYEIKLNGVTLPANTAKNLCPGAYNIQLKDEAGCLQNVNYNIGQMPQLALPPINVTNEKCYNDCQGIIDITPVAGMTYSIDDGFTYHNNNIFQNLCAQASMYKVNVKDQFGCIAKTNVLITQPDPLQINLIDKSVCLNKEVELDANVIGGTNPIDYQWSTGQQSKKIIVLADKDRTYNVTGTDANGCKIAGNVRVALLPQPTANFTYVPGKVDIFNNEVTFTNTSKDYTSNKWIFDVLGTSVNVDDVFKFPAEGGKEYNVCLKVENNDGCRDSICKLIYVNHNALIYVPNVFTPDGDGTNDIVSPVVEGIDPNDYEFLVFNRWGQLLFQTDQQNVGWDGRYKGSMSKEDAYVWKVKGRRLDNGEVVEEIGHVSLLR